MSSTDHLFSQMPLHEMTIRESHRHLADAAVHGRPGRPAKGFPYQLAGRIFTAALDAQATAPPAGVGNK